MDGRQERRYFNEISNPIEMNIFFYSLVGQCSLQKQKIVKDSKILWYIDRKLSNLQAILKLIPKPMQWIVYFFFTEIDLSDKSLNLVDQYML